MTSTSSTKPKSKIELSIVPTDNIDNQPNENYQTNDYMSNDNYRTGKDLEIGTPSKNKKGVVKSSMQMKGSAIHVDNSSPDDGNADSESAKLLNDDGLKNLSSTDSTNITNTATMEKAANAKAIAACINYSFCSVSMILVNKSLASSYNQFFESGGSNGLNVLLVVIQAVIAVICVEFCRISGLIENYPPITPNTATSWAPVNLFFCGMLFTGMASLQTNSVPMVTVFKNITNILTTAGDYIWFGSQPEQLVMVAFGVMLIGAVAAAGKDISVTAVGLFWMIMNCFCTAGYVLYMKFATQSIKMSKFGMVYVNNVLCIVFLLPVAYVLGELQLFYETEGIHTVDYAIKNLFAGFVGFFLNFASLSCVQTTGPTTYAIVGSLNKIPVTILGYFLFDNRISGETWFYISISLLGGFIYSYAKIQSSRVHVHRS